MSDVVNITIAVQDQVSATISTAGTQGPTGEVSQSAIEAIAFSYLALNDSGMVAEYRLSAQDGRIEYFPALGGTTEQLSYLSDLDDYVLTSAMQAALLAWNPIYVNAINSNRNGSFELSNNVIKFLTVTDGDQFEDRTIVDSLNLQSAATWAAIYAQTTDPGVEGQPWNNAGHLVFSTGYFPSLDFSNARNSMYIGAI